RHTRSYGDWSSDVCSSDLGTLHARAAVLKPIRQGLVQVRQCLQPARLLTGNLEQLAGGVRPAQAELQGREIDTKSEERQRIAGQIGRASGRERGEGWWGRR